MQFLKNILTDSDKVFSLFVIFVLSIITIPITIREGLSKEIKYYRLPDSFWLNEIASYHVSILVMFGMFLLIIHSNKLLILIQEILYLIIPYLENRLGIKKSDN